MVLPVSIHLRSQEIPANGPQSLIVHVLTQCVSSHVLSGLCKIAGYEILRHATSWENYKSILRTGADPSRGGETTDLSRNNYETFTNTSLSYDAASDTTVTSIETIKMPKSKKSLVIQNAQNKFYVFRDSKIGINEKGEPLLSPWLAPFGKRIAPLKHSYLAYVVEYRDECKGGELSRWMLVASAIKALFTPTVKFIYTLEEIEGSFDQAAIFENDPDYQKAAAYRTSQELPSDRIGLPGFFTHVNKDHAWKHIQNNPTRCIQGVVQLATGILLTVTGLGLIT
jgi:hypothetical protein